MHQFYKQLSTRKKISLMRSMHVMTKSFLKSYEWDLTKYASKEAIMNDLFFYWLRQSAYKQYLWCEDTDNDVFTVEFANEMKVTLYVIYCRMMLKQTYKTAQKKQGV